MNGSVFMGLCGFNKIRRESEKLKLEKEIYELEALEIENIDDEILDDDEIDIELEKVILEAEKTNKKSKK
jgi:hypothetical protein